MVLIRTPSCVNKFENFFLEKKFNFSYWRSTYFLIEIIHSFPFWRVSIPPWINSISKCLVSLVTIHLFSLFVHAQLFFVIHKRLSSLYKLYSLLLLRNALLWTIFESTGKKENHKKWKWGNDLFVVLIGDGRRFFNNSSPSHFAKIYNPINFLLALTDSKSHISVDFIQPYPFLIFLTFPSFVANSDSDSDSGYNEWIF